MRVSKDAGGPWFETRRHSAPKTRVNALMATLLTMRPNYGFCSTSGWKLWQSLRTEAM